MSWLLARRALKYSPIALEAARQLDRQLRPHVLAYGSARDIDGYVGRWTAADGVHWVVFPERDAAPLKAFPPVSAAELEQVAEQLDRASLRHHRDLPEARFKQTGTRIAKTPGRIAQRRREGT